MSFAEGMFGKMRHEVEKGYNGKCVHPGEEVMAQREDPKEKEFSTCKQMQEGQFGWSVAYNGKSQ